MSPILASLVSVVLVSLVSLAGLAALPLDERRIRRLATFLVAFAVGALLGDAFIHLIPQTFGDPAARERPIGRSLLVLAGILVFFVVEKLLRHRHGPLHAAHHGPDEPARHDLVGVNLLGDALHNFIDGVLIGASWLAGPTLGISTTLAVILHEVPQEIGDFAVLVHGGLSARKALLVNLASASVAILGTGLALLLGSVAGARVVEHLLPVAAGGFVYVAAADLIPELQHDRGLRALAVQTALVALGIALMGLLTLLE